MMVRWLLLVLIGLALLAPSPASAQFTFSLPGKWGSGKRSAPPAWSPASERRVTDCADFDPETIFNLYRTVQVEALRISECLIKSTDGDAAKH